MMEQLRQIAVWAALLLLVREVSAAQRNEPKPVAAQRSGLGAPALADAQRYRAIRTFEDWSTHQRWIVFQDLNHPGWPARLAPSPGSLNLTAGAPGIMLPPMIRNGEAILVREHTRVADGVLEATALGSAGVGAALKARLRRGGRIVSVMVEGPGRATLPLQETEARP
jgi:hypothetical protein